MSSPKNSEWAVTAAKSSGRSMVEGRVALPALARKLREAAARRGNRAPAAARSEKPRVEPAEVGP